MNNLKITPKTLGRIITTQDITGEITVFIPTNKKFANAKVLDAGNDFFTAHWLSNFNTFGDFESELMRFNDQAILDEADKQTRNEEREANGLIKIR